MIRNRYFLLVTICSTLLTTSCIETFETTFEDFESAIVVEATITDKLEQQRVFLTRTFEFEDDGPSPETNASVRVEGGGNVIVFEESTPGLYLSTQAFAAQPNIDYQLRIDTQNGRSYSSNQMTLTQTTQIDDLRAERITNDLGEEGVVILVDSFDPTGNSVNYRYQYEETFKIIAPFWTPDDLEKARPDEATQPCDVKVVVDEKSEETCFSSDFSNAIIQTSTRDLAEDRVSDFEVRFINRNNYIISHRYSVLVRQFVQSNEAFTFYETLNEFSGNESFFSETQPGFLEGNISSDSNEDEKVLGYFDVASVVERRIFFNYEDLFPGEELPPYVDPCVPNAPELARGAPPVCVLSTLVENDLVRLLGNNDTPADMEGPYFVAPRVCGDCSEIGKAEIPEFWIEE